MNGVVGKEWISQDFDPATRKLAGDRYRLLIVDGHCSHFTYDFLKYAKDNKIEVLCLPSNTTHVLQTLDVLGFSQFKTAYQKLANGMASECGGRLTHADFLKAIEGPYNEAFSQKNVCKAFEITGTWPINQDRITPDQMASSIGLSLCGDATISPTSPVKAMNAVLQQLPALLPSQVSPDDSTSPTLPTSDLQLAMEELCTKLQATHVSFLFDGSAASSTNAVQPLKFPSVLNTPNLDTSDDDEDSVCFDSKTKEQLQATIKSLKNEMRQIKRFSRGLAQDRITLITQLSLVHTENKKLRAGLFKKEQKRQTARERISPGGKAIVATSEESLTMIGKLGKEKDMAAARKAGSHAVLELSPEEKDRRRELWKIAEREFKDRRDQLKSDGMPVKYAGEKPLLRWFNEANDPEALLQDIQNSNQAFPPQAPRQTRRQRCKTIIYEEDTGEWTDEDGWRND